MNAKIRKFLLTSILPLLKWLGATHFPYTKKNMLAAHYYQILTVAKPGSILLTKTLGEASNLLIPGKYKHAAILGATHRSGRPFVIEATGSGVHQTDLIDFVLTKDSIIVLEPTFANEEQMTSAVLWACKQLGKPYDYKLMSDYEAFYCCELTFAAYKEALGGNSPWELRDFLGEPTVTPDDFLKAVSKWTTLVEFS